MLSSVHNPWDESPQDLKKMVNEMGGKDLAHRVYKHDLASLPVQKQSMISDIESLRGILQKISDNSEVAVDIRQASSDLLKNLSETIKIRISLDDVHTSEEERIDKTAVDKPLPSEARAKKRFASLNIVALIVLLLFVSAGSFIVIYIT